MKLGGGACLVYWYQMLVPINETTAVRDLRYLVELIGIEPMTPGLQSRCSPS
jgi:hypothetical protein